MKKERAVVALGAMVAQGAVVAPGAVVALGSSGGSREQWWLIGSDTRL
jgi:hypothetical protein